MGEENFMDASFSSDTSREVPSSDRLRKVVKRELQKFQDLPDYLRTNEYILKYYRSDWPLKQVFGSLFAIHNETLNIWTHLIGFLIFVGLTVKTATHLPSVRDFSRVLEAVDSNITNFLVPQPTHSYITRWPFFVFLGGAMTCLLFSSSYHLLNCYSHFWHTTLHQLDHAGIAILIAASFYPPVYYTFICYPVLRNAYLSAITGLGVLSILFSSLPLFRTPEFRPLRALSFLSMGLSGIVPAVHRLVLFRDEADAYRTLGYEIGMAGFYGVGAFLYATRIPERLIPGRFDIIGHSHQIFHVLVVAGAYSHYQAGLLDLEWRDSSGCT